ncbi:nucleophosmin [Wolffia australiana]
MECLRPASLNGGVAQPSDRQLLVYQQNLHPLKKPCSKERDKQRDRVRFLERETMGVRSSLVFLLALLMILEVRFAIGATQKKVASTARKEDVPFIKCQVCEKIAHQLYRQVKQKEDQISPRKISELQIIDIAENICNLKKEEADWLLRIDIVEKGDALELVEQEVEGHCNSECKTLERACQEVMGYSDTDIAEFIYTSKPSQDSLVKFLCYKTSSSCSKKPPPLPKDRAPGEPFVPKPSKELEMEKILRSMEGMPGAPSMKMYSREDLVNNNFKVDGDDDEGDDDDDNDDFPSKLGKVLREKETGQLGLKQRALREVKRAQESIRAHGEKTAHLLRKWWRKGAATSPKDKKKLEL